MKKKVIVVTMMLVLCMSLTGCKSSDYKKAISLESEGDYG